MALLTTPFKPSYMALKSLRQKVSNYTTTSITLPHQPKNLSTNLHPYLDNAIITLNTLTAYLYNNNAPQAVRVVKVKKGVKKVDIKVNKIKAKVMEVKAQVDKVDKKVNKIDKKVNKVDKKVNKVDKKVNKINKKVTKIKTEIKSLKECQNYLKS